MATVKTCLFVCLFMCVCMFVCLYICIFDRSKLVETRGQSWLDQPGQNAQARLQKADSVLA